MNMIALKNFVKSAIFYIARLKGEELTYGEVTKQVAYGGQIVDVTVLLTEEDFITYNEKMDANTSFACAFT